MTARDTFNAVAGPIAIASANVVRDAIARCALRDAATSRDAIPDRLGRIHLRPHQLDAAARLGRLLRESGGALLADEVGLGKTYVALALARGVEQAVVVAPAALLPMWRSALERARLRATLVSFERLSRAGEHGIAWLPAYADLVVVDEAHHVRTPTTRRYAALARLCSRSRVLLLSATPLHNSRRDLAAQLALFLGAAAWAMSDAELARHVVRRTRDDLRIEENRLPGVDTPVWIELPTADDCLDALLALPPPLAASDGGDGGVLLVYSLVRQWASSRAALRATLRRRLARAVGLCAALEAGRYPSRDELAAWSYAEGVVQLAFPELVPAGEDDYHTAGQKRGDNAVLLLAAVRAHEAAVRELLRTLDLAPDPDLDRAAALRAIRARHAGERVLAFSESAETVDAMFRMLRADGAVAMLRARGATVSGGPLTRQEALSRFAPVAQGARAPAESERIDLLLTTDLLSEGVNLQDASVVVHLDLPWNPARLEQRVGRISRLGSPHARVAVYVMRPPTAAERLLNVERRLRAKLATAGRAIGVVGAILPGLARVASDPSAAEDWTRVHAGLQSWLATGDSNAGLSARAPPCDAVSPLVAAVASPGGGFLAALTDGDSSFLVASLGRPPSTAPAVVARAIEHGIGAEASVDEDRLVLAVDAIQRWVTRRAAAALSGVDASAIARARRRVLSRITAVASRAPRHLRSIFSPLAAEARSAALIPLGVGAERVLAELAEAPLPDEAWLRAVGVFGALHRRSGVSREPGERAGPRLVAVLLFEERDSY